MVEKERTITKKGVTLKTLKPKAFVCYHCKKSILENQKYVIVGTHIGIKERETFSEYFYHLNCWVESFNLAVKKKLDEAQKQAMDVIKQSPMFNMIKGLITGGVQ